MTALETNGAPGVDGLLASALAELHQDKLVITTGLAASIEAAKRLLKIRESRSYRLEADTFEEFCRANWNFGASRARQICAEARVVESLNLHGSVTPGNVSQVRALMGLPVGERTTAWGIITATAPGGVISRSHVEQFVKARKAELGQSVTRGNALAVPDHGTNGTNDQSSNHPVIQSSSPAASPAASREERLREATQQAISKVRLVLDLGGTADSEAAAEVRQALEKLEDFEVHLTKLQRLQASRGTQDSRLQRQD